MYSGSVSGNHPIISGVVNTNWHVCNGSNGSPDLRNKFIVGSGSSYSLNDTGGQSSSTHTHSFNPSNAYTTNSPVTLIVMVQLVEVVELDNAFILATVLMVQINLYSFKLGFRFS